MPHGIHREFQVTSLAGAIARRRSCGAIRRAAPTADVIPGKSFAIHFSEQGGNLKHTIDLDLEIVKRWLADPADNNGIILTDDNPNSRVQILGSGESEPESRPLLTLVYQ